MRTGRLELIRLQGLAVSVLALAASALLLHASPARIPSRVTEVPTGRALSFAERVAAQEAIERVYYSHQLDATLSFEQAVPRSLLERKVQKYLQESAALESFWHTPVTADMLAAEWLRIARESRFPERLREIGAALGDDPFLIQECFIRPVLANRLTRGFFDFDPRFQANARVPKQSWEAWWEEIRPRLDPAAVVPVAFDAWPDFERAGVSRMDLTIPSPGLPATTESCIPDDTWLQDPVPDGRRAHTAVWTGTQMIIWGGQTGLGMTRTGSRYDPLTDTWTPMSTLGAPHQRYGHNAIWTGSRMIVWGGTDNEVGFVILADGGQYDPAADAWIPISTVNAPEARSGFALVWDGSRMVVWGGRSPQGSYLATGGRYDPATDSWSATSLVGAPSARSTAAVWTGSRMIVWGGSNTNTGGLYDPAADVWTPTSTAGAPAPRFTPTLLWTGSVMIVWGGYWGGSSLTSGGRYDPATDSWTPTALAGAPTGRSDYTAVWADNRMIVWGGYTSAGYSSEGGRYNPATDSWSPTSLAGAPSARVNHTAVWTGARMVVWGGGSGVLDQQTGGRYDPTTNTWTPTTVGSAPSGRRQHTAVWTGNQVIVWGGNAAPDWPYHDSPTATGGRFDPTTASWSPTTSSGAPSPRWDHTAIWTGSRMVVWGGAAGTFDAEGGRYDPIADSWSPTTTFGAPAARSGHTAIWTGSRMIVWGGYTSPGYPSEGGRYNPATDTWSPISLAGAPSARTNHTAVWTGSRMIVWGGYDDSSGFATGGRYDPVADAWSPTTTVGAPNPRFYHTALWTGTRMVVWGGSTFVPFDSGGRYDPVNDSWQATSTLQAPTPRHLHTAVWTGAEMVVFGGNSGNPDVVEDTGGRYDPAADTWTPTSTASAPSPRFSHTAVWTNGGMFVWGGSRLNGTLRSGGTYNLGDSLDRDQDGWSHCTGDCDDSALAVHPGAPEGCDGRDTDCDGNLPLYEHDADGDGWPACAECDDTHAYRFPGNVERCDGVDHDCDGVADSPSPAETNDGLDNDCTSGPGHGLIDEISGTSGFLDPGNAWRFIWPAQAGATLYEALRSDRPDFASGCAWTTTADPFWVDASLPASRGVFYYLVRAVAPHPGSLGRRSSGVERTGVCGVEQVCSDGYDDDGDGAVDCSDPADCYATSACPSTQLSFVDTPADDVAANALQLLLAAVPATGSDFVHVSLSGPSLADFEWCAERADFYKTSYLALAPVAGTAISGGWNKWYRSEGSGWSAPETAGHDNWFGDDCAGAFSWCAEVGLGGHIPGVAPSEVGICEAFDDITCGSWTFTLRIGVDRLAACGF